MEIGHATNILAILAAIVSIAIALLICVVRAYINIIMGDKDEEKWIE